MVIAERFRPDLVQIEVGTRVQRTEDAKGAPPANVCFAIIVQVGERDGRIVRQEIEVIKIAEDPREERHRSETGSRAQLARDPSARTAANISFAVVVQIRELDG